jgi:hypothetical protein
MVLQLEDFVGVASVLWTQYDLIILMGKISEKMYSLNAENMLIRYISGKKTNHIMQ